MFLLFFTFADVKFTTIGQIVHNAVVKCIFDEKSPRVDSVVAHV